MIKIKHGFTGQRLVVFPFYMIEEALQNSLTSELAIHSMGYFPNAEHHYIDRPSGTDEYILIYCIKGQGFYTLNGERQTVKANQFFILPPNVAHQYGASENHPWHIYWAHYKGSRADAVYEKLAGLQTITTSENSRMTDRKTLFDEMLNVMEGHTDSESICYVNMCFNQLLASFLYIDVYREAKFPSGKSENISFISRATHYMNENIENRLTIHDMASHMGYSESHFYRLFYEQTHYAPMTYFMHLKINHACYLISSTRLQINQIAMKLGFDDPYYFSRFFKKMTGKSPKEYRVCAFNHQTSSWPRP
ncbi:MAG: AraC family transcriptional regulator [Prevotella sp.]|nr:AraC family transcriptional regulator [Prevotella sp.]